MKIYHLLVGLILGSIFAPQQLLAEGSNTMQDKIVIAHRGASGYLPEHTLAAKAMAYAMGADYIEQDVVMTKDNQVIVLHDPFLDAVTDVADKFPKRYRIWGGKRRWLAMDFTLAEIKTLKAGEAFNLDENGQPVAKYAERFPLFKSDFQIATLAEEIELIQGLNKSTGQDTGIYVEIKSPFYHRQEGKDITRKTLDILKSYGYTHADDKAYIQCFDPDELKRIKNELMPNMGMKLKLVQLIAETDWQETKRIEDGQLVNYSYDWFFEPGAMAKVAEYAQGIGPWFPMLVEADDTAGIKPSTMLKEAKATGLIIHPFTFRKDPGQIPPFAKDFDDFLDIYYRQLDVQGVFTDFPDLAVKYLKNRTF
ncbi:MAG: glycerophosphodiester phosphodiesterase [Gammaproteobacteria bacterium]|nr:glycerophosphodiester phosphodiesterase [Gammaproteobacteria bacterium]NNJ71827.1 glycerophosphodiester phosphodiesterase [Enterobacterales bacterium]